MLIDSANIQFKDYFNECKTEKNYETERVLEILNYYGTKKRDEVNLFIPILY